MDLTKSDRLDEEVHRLLYSIIESERNIVDNGELGDMVRRLIKMHDEETKDKNKD